MSSRTWIAGWFVLTLLAFFIGRPLGDTLLHALSGGSSTGALLLGLGCVLLPMPFGLAWLLRRYRLVATGVAEVDLPPSPWLATACCLSFTPFVVFPMLVSRSGADTPLEQSELFGWFMLGGLGGLLLWAPVLWVMARRRRAALRAGALVRSERARSSATAGRKQTPDKVRRRRRRRRSRR